jgi:hypothetical protein
MGPQRSEVPSGPLRWGHGHRESGGAKELWDRLQNEPERAYLAFEAFLALPGGQRTILAAYRNHVGNPCAAKPSDTWSGWSSRFAWRERAAAYDRHLERLRAKAVEEAVEEEAKRHARLVERMRYETMEELSALHVGVMGYLDNLDWSSIRMQDVIQILKLKLDAAMRFEESAQARAGGAGGREPDWTLEAWEFADGIVREIEAEGDREERAGEDEETSKS